MFTVHGGNTFSLHFTARGFRTDKHHFVNGVISGHSVFFLHHFGKEVKSWFYALLLHGDGVNVLGDGVLKGIKP